MGVQLLPPLDELDDAAAELNTEAEAWEASRPQTGDHIVNDAGAQCVYVSSVDDLCYSGQLLTDQDGIEYTASCSQCAVADDDDESCGRWFLRQHPGRTIHVGSVYKPVALAEPGLYMAYRQDGSAGEACTYHYAMRKGIMPTSKKNARIHKRRFSDFPAPAARVGLADVFFIDEIRAFYARHPQLDLRVPHGNYYKAV